LRLCLPLRIFSFNAISGGSFARACSIRDATSGAADAAEPAAAAEPKATEELEQNQLELPQECTLPLHTASVDLDLHIEIELQT
jgi:hypothetical protein